MGGPKGMVFTFDTPSGKDQYCFLRAWNCSWISNFKEEDEVLFFGGYLRIKVHTLRLMETKENFQEFVAAIWYLDAMLTGADIRDIKSNKKNHFIIDHLMNHSLNKPVSATFPAHIYEQFSCFAINKKQIILDLDCLSNGDEKMNDLILSSLERRYNEEKKREDTDVRNLIRSELLSIFPNVQTLIIITTGYDGSDLWSFSLIGLLSLISESDLSQIIIKTVKRNNTTWTQKLWNSEEKSLKKMYSAKKFVISASDNMGTDDEYPEFWLKIKKTN